ncbi:NACHT, LRR and PYD domains-containing protein 3-like [Pholidichthys leucotaenia]
MIESNPDTWAPSSWVMEQLKIYCTTLKNFFMMDLQTVLKTTLKNKYQHLTEAYSSKFLLPPRLCYRDFKQDNILCDLQQHEFRYVDKSYLAEWHHFEVVPLTDILSCDCEHDGSKRTVITLGVSGVGKTTTVQTCALEWAKGRGYHNIRYLFPLTFWELNLLKDELSLVELLQTFYPDLKALDASTLSEDDVWLVFDGLDEYKGQLNFDCPAVSDVSKASTVDVLVTNLIRGNLLPKSHIWITTRYSSVFQIPDGHILKETEVQGFSDEQKMEYFRAAIGDDDLAKKAMDHVYILRSLYFLCQIPPICGMMAEPLMEHLEEEDDYIIDPLNLTQIYSYHLNLTGAPIMKKLKHLAHSRVGKCNVMHVDELLESEIKSEEASAFSREFPFVLREEKGLNNTTVFRFGHSSIEEFLAACVEVENMKKKVETVTEHCRELVDKAIDSPKGEHDVSLRFVFGLITEYFDSERCKDALDYIREKILANVASQTGRALLHSYREYDHRVFMEICECKGNEHSEGCNSKIPIEVCKRVKQLVETFEGIKPTFKIPGPEKGDEQLLRQLPVLLKSTTVVLESSTLTDRICPFLAAVITSRWSYINELDLGNNAITDSGVKVLVQALITSPDSLRTLRLNSCRLTSESCRYLSNVILPTIMLQDLDLCSNALGDEGLRLLSYGLRRSDSQLATLSLASCNIEEMGCYSLALALKTNVYLDELDLSMNQVRDGGAKALFEGISMESVLKLDVSQCGITGRGCHFLNDLFSQEAVVDEEQLELFDINLSKNAIGDEGVGELSKMLANPDSNVGVLRLKYCCLTSISVEYLAKALESNPKFLRELNLEGINMADDTTTILKTLHYGGCCHKDIDTFHRSGIIYSIET